MSKYKRYGFIGSAMMLIAVIFILYAVTHPQASFPWSNAVTYAIYAGYGILTGAMVGLCYRHRPK
ncbi:MAG: hypothetical protein RR350_04855 [Oscillibacter sp.]